MEKVVQKLREAQKKFTFLPLKTLWQQKFQTSGLKAKSEISGSGSGFSFSNFGVGVGVGAPGFQMSGSGPGPRPKIRAGAPGSGPRFGAPHDP